MGIVTDRFLSALSWSGTDIMASMFVISSKSEIPPFEPDLRTIPNQVKIYELDDELRLLGGRHVYEYDIVWVQVPDDLEEIVTACLVDALRQGAIVAWFAFEGSFDFEYILHPDMAKHVYAVAADDGVKVAVDDEYRLSDDWRQFLGELHDRVL